MGPEVSTRHSKKTGLSSFRSAQHSAIKRFRLVAEVGLIRFDAPSSRKYSFELGSGFKAGSKAIEGLLSNHPPVDGYRGIDLLGQQRTLLAPGVAHNLADVVIFKFGACPGFSIQLLEIADHCFRNA